MVSKVNTSRKSVITKKADKKPAAEKAAETSVKDVTADVAMHNIPVKRAQFRPDDGIMCRSIIPGVLVMTGLKSGVIYQWESFGDETEVSYEDLVSAVRASKSHVFAPYFIIENDDFLELYPQVKKVYEPLEKMPNLKDVFSLDIDDMVAMINSMPSGAKNAIKSIAAAMIATDELDSISKVKAIDNIFGTKLSEIG